MNKESLGISPYAQAFIRVSFLLMCLSGAQASLAQTSNNPQIPEGQAHFTPQELEQYYLVYKNPDVRYLRTVFNACLKGAGGTKNECDVLSKWSKDYFRSKFIVLSRNNNTFGGTFITILFQDRPDKVFVAWVYPEGSAKQLTLRELQLAKFSDEDLKRINARYTEIIKDKIHAM